MEADIFHYGELMKAIKFRIRQAQTKVMFSANQEMLCMYWDIGRIINERQSFHGWGAGILRKLAQDLKNELSEIKGFSERKIKLMTQFYREYSVLFSIGQPPVAQLPWAHNILLIQNVKSKHEASGF